MGYALLTGTPLTAATALLSRMPGRHKGIGMKRAVKKKVVVVETAPPADESTGNTGAEQRAASPPTLPASAAIAMPSPGEKKLRQAENEFDEWKAIAAKAQRAEKEEASQLQLAERLYEAKMRRWSNGFKRTKKPSPYGQIERFYKAKLELAGARRNHLQTRLDTADAMAVCADALVRVRDAQIARMCRGRM